MLLVIGGCALGESVVVDAAVEWFARALDYIDPDWWEMIEEVADESSRGEAAGFVLYPLVRRMASEGADGAKWGTLLRWVDKNVYVPHGQVAFDAAVALLCRGVAPGWAVDVMLEPFRAVGMDFENLTFDVVGEVR